jgi:DNA repair protein RadA/Sms
VRPVAHGEERLRELAKLGFTHVILPRENLPREATAGLTLRGVSNIAEALSYALAGAT